MMIESRHRHASLFFSSSTESDACSTGYLSFDQGGGKSAGGTEDNSLACCLPPSLGLAESRDLTALLSLWEFVHHSFSGQTGAEQRLNLVATSRRIIFFSAPHQVPGLVWLINPGTRAVRVAYAGYSFHLTEITMSNFPN